MQFVKGSASELAWAANGYRLDLPFDLPGNGPRKDRQQVLLDLIEARGGRGKWFAAAKDESFLHVALSCGRDFSVEPATLCAPRGILLSSSRDSQLKSGCSLCSVCSTAAAMIRQFR